MKTPARMEPTAFERVRDQAAGLGYRVAACGLIADPQWIWRRGSGGFAFLPGRGKIATKYATARVVPGMAVPPRWWVGVVDPASEGILGVWIGELPAHLDTRPVPALDGPPGDPLRLAKAQASGLGYRVDDAGYGADAGWVRPGGEFWPPRGGGLNAHRGRPVRRGMATPLGWWMAVGGIDGDRRAEIWVGDLPAIGGAE
jgi:hypothetical protein